MSNLPPFIGAPKGRAEASAFDRSIANKTHKTFHKFEFLGNGNEYFLIWLSNLALNIVTLGFYSPWAKVRNELYFMRNTVFDGSSFDYVADPHKILKGRLMAFVVFAILLLASYAFTIASIFALVFALVATPWLMIKSIQFKSRYVLFRNIHFTYVGKWLPSIMPFIGWSFLSKFAFGLLAPYAALQKRKYIFNNLYYGQTKFSLDIDQSPLYSELGKVIKYLIPAYIAIIIAFALSTDASKTIFYAMHGRIYLPSNIAVGFTLLALAFVLTTTIAYLYLQIAFEDIIFNSIYIGEYKFCYFVSYPEYFYIKISNFLLRVFTCGLGSPFARIRLHRFRVQALELQATANLTEFFSGKNSNYNAFGTELASFYDTDFDFGF